MKPLDKALRRLARVIPGGAALEDVDLVDRAVDRIRSAETFHSEVNNAILGPYASREREVLLALERWRTKP